MKVEEALSELMGVKTKIDKKDPRIKAIHRDIQRLYEEGSRRSCISDEDLRREVFHVRTHRGRRPIQRRVVMAIEMRAEAPLREVIEFYQAVEKFVIYCSMCHNSKRSEDKVLYSILPGSGEIREILLHVSQF